MTETNNRAYLVTVLHSEGGSYQYCARLGATLLVDHKFTATFNTNPGSTF